MEKRRPGGSRAYLSENVGGGRNGDNERGYVWSVKSVTLPSAMALSRTGLRIRM